MAAMTAVAAPRPSNDDRIHAALWFADHGFGIFTVWSTTDTGVCRCPSGARCENAGKHPLTLHGFLDATTARKLDIKEDGSGTRKWGYWKLHTLQDPALEVGDRLVIDGKRYKALTSQNRGQHGFWVYGLREDFKP